MHTSLRIDGANCSTCFNDAMDDLALLEGVQGVSGSFQGPCIDVDHDDVPLDVITDKIRNRLHGIEMFANEVRMVPLEPVVISTCRHAPSTGHEPSASQVTARHRIDPSMTLGAIVTSYPSLAVELERRGLDYCCHGGRTLSVAAREAGIDPQTVADELAATNVEATPVEWATLGVRDLVDHIEATHHMYLWQEMPRISALVDKIVSVHGERHPELTDVQRLYAQLRADLEPHLVHEEQVLFPMIRQMSASAGESQPDRASLAAHIEALGTEHETVGALLDELRVNTAGYATPADGCATFAACYRALSDLEADTHLHVHKENNLLFPAVRTLANAAPAATR